METTNTPLIPSVKLLLIDDNLPFLFGLRRFLSERSEIQVVGEAHTGGEALDLIPKLQPDVITVDIVLPDGLGISVVQQVANRYPHIGRVMLTMHQTKEYREAAVEAGAHAFVTKSEITRDLLAAIATSLHLSANDNT